MASAFKVVLCYILLYQAKCNILSCLKNFTYKEAVIYGIPAKGFSCGRKQFTTTKFIIPVDSKPEAEEVRICPKREIYSAGFHPATYYSLDMVPLRRYLQNFTIPSYIRFKMFYPDLSNSTRCNNAPKTIKIDVDSKKGQ